MRIQGLNVLTIWVIFWTYWLISALRTRSPFKRRQPYPSALVSTAVLFIICVIFSRGAPSGLLTWQVVPRGIAERLAGIIITILGLSLSVCAREYLGRYWSSRPEIKVDHKLIRTGPYRLVRHPIYTGILVGFFGTAIAIGRVWALLLVLVILCSFLLKIRAEEKLLLEEFGEAYSQYKKEVKALIPFVV